MPKTNRIRQRGLILSGLVLCLATISTVDGAFWSTPVGADQSALVPTGAVEAALLSDRSKPQLRTVPSVDLERYMGLWYEIGRYPNSFQKGLIGVTAEYTLRDDGTVFVENRGRLNTFDGRERTVTGKAWVKCKNNTRLSVQFFWPFRAPYWIIDLDPKYGWAVVGQPSRDYLWILSRSKQLDQATLDGIYERLRKQAYDPSRLKLTPQPAD